MLQQNDDQPLLVSGGGGPPGLRRRPLTAQVVVSLGALAVALTGLGVGFYSLGFAAYETGCAAGVNEVPTCTFVDGHAAAGRGAAIFVATWAKNRTGCCDTCMGTDGCATATYLGAHAESSTSIVNCLLYDDTLASAPIERPFASVCNPPEAGWTMGWLQMWLDDPGQPVSDQSLIGGAALIMRVGYFVGVMVLSWLQRVCGFHGASLPESVMGPRQAASAAARAATMAVEPPPAATGWASLAGSSEQWDVATEANRRAQTTWAEAMTAQGLGAAQACWAAGAKLLLWHWLQPIGFLACLAFYYCGLRAHGTIPLLAHFTNAGYTSADLALVVAVREVLYLLLSLLAVYLCPAFLLVELDSATREATAEQIRCTRGKSYQQQLCMFGQTGRPV